MKASPPMKVILHDPVVVSQAPAALRAWGPWQFPLLQSLGDGRLLLEYHREADSARAYGLPGGQSISADGGETWEEVPAPGIIAGLRLPDGDELRAIQEPSLPTEPLSLPGPLAHIQSSYPLTFTYYRRGDLPPELQGGWWFQRRAAGGAQWLKEQARVEIPDPLATATEGVLVIPFFEHNRIQVAPDGRLFATQYIQPQLSGGRFLVRRYLAMFLESLDSGRTWQLKGCIPYYPDPQEDLYWDERDGFTEPQAAALPDGSTIALLRTTDGNGVGPLYWARSLDGGATWDLPRVFDHFGVWPQIAVLTSGVILAAYGRPGLFLRAARDPGGKKWGPRIAIVEPGELGQDTCSYSSLLPLPDGGALIAYSDFNYPDSQGQPRKTILVRRIEVR
jgi:hypothetical protein